MLPQSQRLHEEKDFMRVYRYGRRHVAGWLAAAWYAGGGKGVRVGIIVPNTAARKAVKRNLLKRRMRAAVAEHLQNIPQGLDLVLTARSYPRNDLFSEITAQVSQIISSLHRHTPSTPRPYYSRSKPWIKR